MDATQENQLEEVIRSMREERERDRAANNALNDAKITQIELNKVSIESAKKVAEANLDSAKAEAINSKTKINEATEKAKVNAQEVKNEKKKLEQQDNRSEVDKSHTANLASDLERMRINLKKKNIEGKEFDDLIDQMGKIREMIKSPIEKLYDTISNKAGFSVKKRPLSTFTGLTGLAVNSIVNQDKVPPIFGILTKAITGSLIFGLGVLERSFENKLTKLRGLEPEADEMIKTDQVLREIAAVNKKLALEIASLRIVKLRDEVQKVGKAEKEILLKEADLRKAEKHGRSSEDIFKNLDGTIKKETSNIVNEVNEIVKEEAQVKRTNRDTLDENTPDVHMTEQLDDLIVLVKSIKNQFDPETESERYNEEVVWRKEVLERLDLMRTSPTSAGEKKSMFGILESGAFASIATFVSGIISSVGKFLTPLAFLGKGLLRFATPLGLAATVLMTLDWEKDLLAPINRIKDTFTDGSYLEAIFRTITMPTDILMKFLNRSSAMLAGFFGFEDIEKELNLIADNINFVDSIIQLKSSLMNYINDITSGVDFSGVKGLLAGKIDDIKNSIVEFDLGKSINELFDFISDKIESLKFWKNDKVFKTPDFIQKILPQSFLKPKEDVLNKSITTSTTNEKNINNNISDKQVIEKIENTVNKIDPSKSINRLTTTHDKLIEKQTSVENSKLEKMTDKLSNITTNVVNQQVNNSNVTSINGRPRPRIEDRYSHSNHSSDFSGYQIA